MSINVSHLLDQLLALEDLIECDLGLLSDRQQGNIFHAQGIAALSEERSLQPKVFFGLPVLNVLVLLTPCRHRAVFSGHPKTLTRLPPNDKRCLIHLVYLEDSYLAAEYLRSAWTQGKFNRHNTYFVVVSHLGAFANETTIMDFERLYFITDQIKVQNYYGFRP